MSGDYDEPIGSYSPGSADTSIRSFSFVNHSKLTVPPYGLLGLIADPAWKRPADLPMDTPEFSKIRGPRVTGNGEDLLLHCDQPSVAHAVFQNATLLAFNGPAFIGPGAMGQCFWNEFPLVLQPIPGGMRGGLYEGVQNDHLGCAPGRWDLVPVVNGPFRQTQCYGPSIDVALGSAPGGLTTKKDQTVGIITLGEQQYVPPEFSGTARITPDKVTTVELKNASGQGGYYQFQSGLQLSDFMLGFPGDRIGLKQPSFWSLGYFYRVTQPEYPPGYTDPDDRYPIEPFELELYVSEGKLKDEFYTATKNASGTAHYEDETAWMGWGGWGFRFDKTPFSISWRNNAERIDAGVTIDIQWWLRFHASISDAVQYAAYREYSTLLQSTYYGDPFAGWWNVTLPFS